MVNRHIIDRKLPEKAFMRFYYPSTEGRVPSTIVTVPFFENPVIKESKRARYKKYSLISRSSNLYSYLGADSRKLSISFSLSLPHLMEEYPQASQANYLSENLSLPTVLTSPAEKAKFTYPDKSIPRTDKIAGIQNRFLNLEGLKDTVKTVLTTDWALSGITLQELDYIDNIYGLHNDTPIPAASLERLGTQLESIKENTGTNSIESVAWLWEDARDATLLKRLKTIEIIMYWVNIIRSSVINNAGNPLLGPPVVRLNHGVMYQNVACLCTDYSINIKEAWGYDVHTMMPRSLDIKMNLEELKAGNFQEYKYGEIINQDNLNGWESIIDEGSVQSLDPGYLV
jgi:hypothetical protein